MPMPPADESRPPKRDLEDRLGYSFRGQDLLLRALTHSSYANEAVEFLGDAVLSFLMAEILFRRSPEGEEGAMSRTKAHLVSDANLARLGESLGLGVHLRLGVGEEKSGGRGKASLLAGAMEALIGATFLDGGTRAARSLVRRLLLPQLDREARTTPPLDPKTVLQELLQGTGRPAPRYDVVDESGPDHRKRFRVRAVIAGGPPGEGEGTTKKAAEQAAARQALARLRARPARGAAPDGESG